jgi:hypothetical protein
VAAKNSSAIILGNNPLYIEKLAQPFELQDLEAFAMPGGELAFYPDGRLMVIGRVDRDVHISGDVWASQGSSVEFLPDGSVVVGSIAKPVRSGPRSEASRLIPVGARVRFITKDRYTFVVQFPSEKTQQRSHVHENMAVPFDMVPIFDCASPSGAKMQIYGPRDLNPKSDAVLGYYALDLSQAGKNHGFKPVRLSFTKDWKSISVERFSRNADPVEIPISGGVVQFDRKWGEDTVCHPAPANARQ